MSDWPGARSRRPSTGMRASVEVVVLVASAVVILAIGIRMGMLVAPRVERMTDRLGRVGPGEPAEPIEAMETPPQAADEGDA
jgi:hypothetical protein